MKPVCVHQASWFTSLEVTYAYVQVDPIELWETKPFGHVMEDGLFKGRGADDDKGGLMTALAVRIATSIPGPRMACV